jgi:hypothetical protein
MFLYSQSAKLKYSPASSLLADIHYYGSPPSIDPDHSKALPHLHDVLEYSDSEVPEDAYVRIRALQKLFNITRDRDHINEAMKHCRAHLGGNYAVLLPHDPVQFFENLESERTIIDDIPKISQNLGGFAHSHEEGPVPLPALVKLRKFTNELRGVENGDDAWLVAMLEESQRLFGTSNVSAAASWGVTYLQSCMRVLGHPAVQSALQQAVDSKRKPHVVSLGSALGNTVTWPAIAFNFSGVGFDVLGSVVEKANSLVPENVEAEFKQEDVLSDAAGAVKQEIAKADVIWINDFAWGKEANERVEKMCLESMKDGAVAIMYREVAGSQPDAWEMMGGVRVATSWHPNAGVAIVRKTKKNNN